MSAKVPNILIVEDQDDDGFGLAALLRKEGYAVAVATSYKDALKVAGREKPNIVLCDIGLPDGDGCDLLRELKQKYQLAGVAVSGHGLSADQQRYREAGFSEFVIKPFKIEEIKNAIVRAVLFAPRLDSKPSAE